MNSFQFGGVDFARVSLSPLAEFVPKLNVLQMPYLYTGREHMWKVLEGPIGTDFMNSFGGSSLVPLSWYDAGARNFYSTAGPIESLDDMKGLKIRVQESELMMDTIQALGATPVPMAFGDVYSGLQTGEIDGAENNWPSYESTRHYEVAKYFTLDEHTRVPSSSWQPSPPGISCRRNTGTLYGIVHRNQPCMSVNCGMSVRRPQRTGSGEPDAW